MRSPAARWLRRAWVHVIVQLLISAAFLVSLVLVVGGGDLTSALSRANLWWLVPAVGANLAGNFVRAIRWHFLLLPIGYMKVRQLFGVMLIALAVNSLLPLRAGDLFRFQYMGARGFDRAEVVGTLATERLLDALIFTLFLVAGALAVELSTALNAFIIAYVFGIGVGFMLGIAFAGLASKQEDFWLLRLVPTRFRKGAAHLFTAFARGLAPLRRPKLLAICAGTSAAAWLLEAMIYVTVGRSLGLEVDFFGFLVVVGIANTIVALPLTQAGIGPYEFFTTYIVDLLGAARDVAAAYAIVVHAAVAVPLTLAGLLAIWVMGLNLREVLYLRRPSKEATAAAT